MHIPSSEDLEQASKLAEQIKTDKQNLTGLKELKARVKANEKELKRLLRGTTTRKPKAKPTTPAAESKAKKPKQFGAFTGETKAGE